MRIPSRLQIFGATIVVKDDPGLLPSHSWVGCADYHRNEIRPQPVSEAFPTCHCNREQVFCHELVHHIAEAIGLEMSERDVDLFGRALHQAMTTMEYNDKESLCPASAI